jgi:pSer/pThr/pTyr-binding forkhead associated (FHA) protein
MIMNFKLWLLTEANVVYDWALQKFKDPKAAQAFTAWFKNSKIVNQDGTPKVVMHYTNANFSQFDLSKFGKTDYGYFGKGFYFTEVPMRNNSYGSIQMQVYLSIQNPYVANNYEDPLVPYNFYNHQIEQIKKENPNIDQKKAMQIAVEKWNEEIKKIGFDGVYSPDSNEIVAFYPNQIKSAQKNTGSFDPNNPNIHDENEKPSQGNGNLTLIPQETNKPIPVKIDAVLGKDIIATPNSQKFMSQRQFVLKKANNGWTIAQSPEAKNSTNVNGKPIGFNPQPLNNGDIISLGKTNQVPVKVTFN